SLPSLAAEGAIALAMMAATIPLPSGAVSAAGGSSVAPGPWSPPGRQPIPFYIGNTAHEEIAEVYRASHLGDRVMLNRFAISTILARLASSGTANNPSAVRPRELQLEPDITNLTRFHLYEIKPQSQESIAASEASFYLGLFVGAGVPMTLGPVTEPGTSGIVPAPGGYYAFESPQPGVIVYQYRRGTYVPVPVPVESPSNEREPQSDFMRRMAAATGLSGAALIVYLIISEGTRVIPVRNLVPVP